MNVWKRSFPQLELRYGERKNSLGQTQIVLSNREAKKEKKNGSCFEIKEVR